jgi:hypothetical protein
MQIILQGKKKEKGSVIGCKKGRISPDNNPDRRIFLEFIIQKGSYNVPVPSFRMLKV